MTHLPAKFFLKVSHGMLVPALALLLAGFAPLLAVAEGAEGAPLLAHQESGRVERLQSSRFPEPLLSVVSSEAERLDLVAVLAEYEGSGDRGVLEGFLDRHPGSGWKAAILGNLGFVALEEGRYSRA
ncbi:MAG: hypothetical protein LBO79_11455, partial [Zoogloeaceae bacterium]|nr:hypothetical protein [Zoogloeaceae bacterium]